MMRKIDEMDCPRCLKPLSRSIEAPRYEILDSRSFDDVDPLFHLLVTVEQKYVCMICGITVIAKDVLSYQREGRS